MTSTQIPPAKLDGVGLSHAKHERTGMAQLAARRNYSNCVDDVNRSTANHRRSRAGHSIRTTTACTGEQHDKD